MAAISKPFFVVPLDLGTITAGNETAGYPASSLNRHKAIGLTWKSTGTADLYVRGQMSSAKPVDFCSIVAANAQAGTQFRLRLGWTQAEVDGAAPYDSGWQTFAPPYEVSDSGSLLSLNFLTGSYQVYSTAPTSHSHLEISSTVSATWWRIDIQGHTGDFQAADLVLGKKVTPSRYYNFDYEYGVEDMGGMEITRLGVMNEEPGVVMRTLNFTLAWQSEAEFESNFRPLMETLGKKGIVFCCFDPTASEYRRSRTYMGVFRTALFAKGVRKPRTFQQDFEILSFI